MHGLRGTNRLAHLAFILAWGLCGLLAAFAVYALGLDFDTLLGSLLFGVVLLALTRKVTEWFFPGTFG